MVTRNNNTLTLRHFSLNKVTLFPNLSSHTLSSCVGSPRGGRGSSFLFLLLLLLFLHCWGLKFLDGASLALFLFFVFHAVNSFLAVRLSINRLVVWSQQLSLRYFADLLSIFGLPLVGLFARLLMLSVWWCFICLVSLLCFLCGQFFSPLQVAY